MTYVPPGVAPLRDEIALRDELPDRLADRDAPDTERCREFAFVGQAVSRTELSAVDL
ncbi:hypothetical protein LUX57_49905 [Actinomadura madurae]|nr:hypothetical protein [Actinomadura madurae]MCP9972205.1 hypothetical protein [Actinomadura madurae]MCQ0003742.1 hypothetical protein [Actinomadura madurae]